MKRHCDSRNVEQGRVTFPPFDAPHIVAVKSAELRKLLLGEPAFLAQLPHPLAEWTENCFAHGLQYPRCPGAGLHTISSIAGLFYDYPASRQKT